MQRETRRSKNGRNSDGWDPNEITETFTTWLKCHHAICGEDVAVIGLSGFDPEFDENGMTFQPVLLPRLVHPMPDMFEIPSRCPPDVKKEIRSAFTCFWIDPSASANRLRVSLELLLDFVGIKRRRRAPGKILDLPLHQRIELYQKMEPTVAPSLMAIKWLGNTASHDSVSHDSLLDAMEIFEHALVEVLEGRSRRVANLAKKLTADHHKRRRPKGRRQS